MTSAVPLPDFAQIEPVGECNLRCRMCPVQFRQDGRQGPPAFIDFNAFTALVDQLPNLRRLQLQGLGEPFMHPRFLDMVRYAANRGIEVAVNTNLTLITERLARETVASGLRYLYASIDGASAATFETIRSRANFQKVTRNLRRLLHARRSAHTDVPVIELVYVVMRCNLDELPRFIDLAAKWGVDAVSVQHLCHEFGESTLPERYESMRDFVASQTLLGEAKEHVDAVFAHAARNAQQHGLALRLPAFENRARKHPRCTWPWNGVYVSYNGEALPCCMVSTPDRITMGNALHAGLNHVWNGERYRAFRQALESGDPPEICRSCAVYNGTF